MTVLIPNAIDLDHGDILGLWNDQRLGEKPLDLSEWQGFHGKQPLAKQTIVMVFYATLLTSHDGTWSARHLLVWSLMN